MSDPLRTQTGSSPLGTQAGERDATIERLLLEGLDHYFASRYDQAINVWTRVLFLDRGHARARAYIERARSALAERQRESEELLYRGVQAFNTGEGRAARELLTAALERGGPNEVALALLARLSRLQADPPAESVPTAPPIDRPPTAEPAAHGARRAPAQRVLAIAGIAALVGLAAAVVVGPEALATLVGFPTGPPVPVATGRPHDRLPVPRASESLVARARALAAAGHLSESLSILNGIRPTDPMHSEASRLKTDVQRRLLALAQVDPRPRPAALPVQESPPRE